MNIIILFFSLVFATSLTHAVETTDSGTQTDISAVSLKTRNQLDDIEPVDLSNTNVTCPKYVDWKDSLSEHRSNLDFLRSAFIEVKAHWGLKSLNFGKDGYSLLTTHATTPDNRKLIYSPGSSHSVEFGKLVLVNKIECNYSFFSEIQRRDMSSGKIVMGGYSELTFAINRSDIQIIAFLKKNEVVSLKVDPSTSAEYNKIEIQNDEDCVVM